MAETLSERLRAYIAASKAPPNNCPPEWLVWPGCDFTMGELESLLDENDRMRGALSLAADDLGQLAKKRPGWSAEEAEKAARAALAERANEGEPTP